MNSIAVRFFLMGLALTIGMGAIGAETPTQAVDRLWKSAGDPTGAFYSAQGVWTLSKTIAHEQGVAVISPVMARSKNWTSEEVLVFVPLIYCLPFAKAVPILEQYKKSGKPWEQQCAADLLIEITQHSGDLADMEKQLSKE